jgi:hypothetical protein
MIQILFRENEVFPFPTFLCVSPFYFSFYFFSIYSALIFVLYTIDMDCLYRASRRELILGLAPYYSRK